MDAVEGPTPAGQTPGVGQRPVLVAGTDTNGVVRDLSTDGEGKLRTTASASFTQPTSNTAVETHTEVGTASTEIAPANGNRKSLEIQNTGTEACWIKFGAAAVEGKGFKIEPGGSWATGSVIWTGKVYAVCKVAKEAVTTVIEME